MQAAYQVWTNTTNKTIDTATTGTNSFEALGAETVTAQLVWVSGTNVSANLQGSFDNANWDNLGSTMTVSSGTHSAFAYKPAINLYRYYRLYCTAITSSGVAYGYIGMVGHGHAAGDTNYTPQ